MGRRCGGRARPAPGGQRGRRRARPLGRPGRSRTDRRRAARARRIPDHQGRRSGSGHSDRAPAAVGRPVMRRRSIGKPALLAGCALGAWLAIVPSAATAQAFQGNGSVVTGDAAITPGAGSTDVLLRTSETVIDWTPFDTAGTGTIDFLPAGNTALFRSGFQNFTVLNRVIPRDGQGIPTARA